MERVKIFEEKTFDRKGGESYWKQFDIPVTSRRTAKLYDDNFEIILLYFDTSLSWEASWIIIKKIVARNFNIGQYIGVRKMYCAGFSGNDSNIMTLVLL